MFFPALALVALAPVVLGQSYLDGLSQTLNAAGLTQLANITTLLNATTVGQELVAQLPQGNKTLFAPTNQALSGLDPTIASNGTLVADIISYHVVSGNFVNETQSSPNATIGRTLLNDSALVMLEGGKAQVLAWSKAENGSIFVLNQGSNVTVANTTTFENLEIIVIDSVLVPPPNMTNIFGNSSLELSELASVLESTSVPGGSSILAELTSMRGITVFAPNNAGVQAAQSTLSGLASNTTALTAVISNHIINGTSVYSPEINANSSLLSAGGQQYTFSNNATGRFVSVGGSNAVQIVQTDVLAANGVIHIINGVLINTNTDPAAASSAFASATSVAAQPATETGPVGATPTPSAGGGGNGTGAAVINGVPDSVTMGLLVGFALVGQMV
ncbi:Fasciclin-domain-containing protein [Gyrodon lividus]|nr:Fasciclin-domain-containing protein [Gyrodon lividus]